MGIDLGGRTTKAVTIQRQGESFTLREYCFVDTPVDGKNSTPENLGAHLKELSSKMENKSKTVVLALGADDALG